jgi:hypothetical protein
LVPYIQTRGCSQAKLRLFLSSYTDGLWARRSK